MKIPKIIKKAKIDAVAYLRWCQDLEAIPEEEQRQWIYDSLRSKKMLHIFGRYFFPHVIKGTYETPEAHLDLIQTMARPKHDAIIFPRSFAKTTWEKIDSLHDIVYGIEPIILYIGNTASDAQQHLESIKSELENNELLIDIYGFLIPPDYKLSKKWTNSHFETTNKVNMLSRGAGKGRGINIKHQRPTKIIFDDVEDDEQVASPMRRKKLHDWIYNVIFPSLDREHGKIKFIGTVISPLCELLIFYEKFGGIFRKAIEDGQSIWPEYWTLEALEKKRREIGTVAFSQEYLNTAIDLDSALIQPEWLEVSYYQNLETKGMNKIIMYDPQAGEKKNSDSFGLCILGFFPRELHRYVLKIQTGKATQIDQAALVVRTWQENPDALYVGIEKVLTQVAVYQLILDWVAKRIDLPGVNNDNRNISLIAVTPEGKDKVARLQMHQAAFERGEVHLHTSMRAFGEKLTCFPAVDHDDDIDALIYCLEYANRNISYNTYSDENIEESSTIMGNIWNKTF